MAPTSGSGMGMLSFSFNMCSTPTQGRAAIGSRISFAFLLAQGGRSCMRYRLRGVGRERVRVEELGSRGRVLGDCGSPRRVS